MRIVHVIARLNVGGAALSVLELAAEQQRRGHEVLVVAGRIPPGEESMEHVAEELGVQHRHLSTLQRELSPLSDARAVASLRALLRSLRPDVLHTHTSKAGATGRVAAVLAGHARPRAVVHQFHGHVLAEYFSPLRERIFRTVERALAAVSDAVIAVSEEVRDDLVRLRVAPREKIHVIQYGFDLDRRTDAAPGAGAALRAQLGIADDAFVAAWAGRLTEIKRPLDLVRVAAAANVELVLAGDGELRDAVAGDRVHLLGYVDDVASVYAAADVFLLTSANEGTPVVAIEALAAGVPVVATDAGGTRTVVDDGETGLLAPVGDVDALAEHVRRLRDDPELRRRFGETGAARMRERFSTGRMADDVQRLYDELVAR